MSDKPDDGFRAYVGISSIDLTAGFSGKSRYDKVKIKMSGVIGFSADAGYGVHKSDQVRKLKTSATIIASFGEEVRDAGVPNDITGFCIGAMEVSKRDENDSRRSYDIHASLRVALPWDFLPHFLTLREHKLEVIPSFYRKPDREDKKTKIAGYGSVTSFITCITFAPVIHDDKETFDA